jgi:hypothetical protein
MDHQPEADDEAGNADEANGSGNFDPSGVDRCRGERRSRRPAPTDESIATPPHRLLAMAAGIAPRARSSSSTAMVAYRNTAANAMVTPHRYGDVHWPASTITAPPRTVEATSQRKNRVEV